MKLITLLLLFLYTKSSLGLKCYTCSATEDDVDQSCVDSPTMVTNCNKKYCILVRVEYKDPKDKVESILRNCVDKPDYMNDIIEDATHRIYYRACNKDLCNSGSGKGDFDGGDNKALGDKSTIYCPGTGRSKAPPLITPITLLISSILTIKSV